MIFDLYDKNDVSLVREAFKNSSLGITSGSYDLMHPMHDHYINCCRRHCGHDGALIVGVDSDRLVRKRKGEERPIWPEIDRLQSVAERRSVAGAFILQTVEDFRLAVKLLGVKYIFKNQEYRDVEVFGAELPGVELVIVPDFKRAESTSATIARINELYNKQKV